MDVLTSWRVSVTTTDIYCWNTFSPWERIRLSIRSSYTDLKLCHVIRMCPVVLLAFILAFSEGGSPAFFEEAQHRREDQINLPSLAGTTTANSALETIANGALDCCFASFFYLFICILYYTSEYEIPHLKSRGNFLQHFPTLPFLYALWIYNRMDTIYMIHDIQDIDDIDGILYIIYYY